MKNLQAHQSNFLKRLEENKSSHTPARQRLRTGMPLLVLLALVLIVWAVFFIQGTFILPRQIEDAEKYLSQGQVAEDYADCQALLKQKDALANSARTLTEVKANLDTYPSLDTQTYLTIRGCAGDYVALQSVDFQREDGSLTLLAVADSATRAAWFTARLRASGLFDSVAYYGYEVDASMSGAYRNYFFSVNAVLPGGESDV